MTPLEETLGEVFSDYGIRKLPSEWVDDGTTTFVDGIALVVKATGKEYCKVANVNGKISVTRDYGRCSAILRVEKYFAVNTITKADIPKFKDDSEILFYLCKSKYNRSDISKLLSVDNKSPEEIKHDREEINRLINDLALEQTKRKIQERKRVDEIKEFAAKAKEEKQTKTKTNGRRKKKEDNA